MIEILELANGYFRFIGIWPREKKLHLRLTLTDPDGDIDARDFVYCPGENLLLPLALAAMAKQIDELPHWRAVVLGGELSIGTASPDYSGKVEIIN